jgi:hypothetical protein
MAFPSAADLNLANQALGAARARTQLITSFSQGGPEASQINQNYASTRDMLLRMFDWGFAKSTVSLGTALKTYDPTATAGWTNAQPPPPWLYEYTFPASAVKIRAVFGQNVPGIIVPVLPNTGQDIGPQLPYYTWEVVNDGGVKVIVTNAPGALAVVTLGGLDPTVWDASFTNAFVMLLAANIALPLSGDSQLADYLMKQASGLIQDAKVQSANQSVDIQHIMPDWLRARGTGLYDEGISIGGTVIGGRDW